jgi:hypothetical protein
MALAYSLNQGADTFTLFPQQRPLFIVLASILPNAAQGHSLDRRIQLGGLSAEILSPSGAARLSSDLVLRALPIIGR